MAITFLTDQNKQEMVLNTPQNLTEEQKAQARENIGAAAEGETSSSSRQEWITIADITTTEEINKIWQAASGFKRIIMYIYLPSDLSVKSFYGFYTSDMWSSLFGFSFTGEGRKLLLDFEVIDNLGVTLQLNINGNNNSVTNVNNGKLLREGIQNELNGIGTALQNNGIFPIGTVVKIRGLKA